VDRLIGWSNGRDYEMARSACEAQGLGVSAGEVDGIAAGEDRPGEGIRCGRLERVGGDDDGATALGVNDDHHARMVRGADSRVDVDALRRNPDALLNSSHCLVVPDGSEQVDLGVDPAALREGEAAAPAREGSARRAGE
jgi:hypothetical protein